MEKDDGTAAFRDDASFYRRAGGPRRHGLRCLVRVVQRRYRYLRHYDYLLYTPPADTTLARADATFYAE